MLNPFKYLFLPIHIYMAIQNREMRNKFNNYFNM